MVRPCPDKNPDIPFTQGVDLEYFNTDRNQQSIFWVLNFENLYFWGTGHSCCIFWGCQIDAVFLNIFNGIF